MYIYYGFVFKKNYFHIFKQICCMGFKMKMKP